MFGTNGCRPLIAVVVQLLSFTAASSRTTLRDVAYEHRTVGFEGGGWVTGLEVHKDSGLIYARTDVGGAYRSDDGGGNWTWLSGSIEAPEVWSTQGLAVNQSEPTGQTLLMGVGGGVLTAYSGVYKSTDGGQTFRHTLSGVAFNGEDSLRHASPALIIDEGRPWRVWAATTQGLWRSENGGESWSPVTAFNSALWFNASSPLSQQAFVSIVPPGADGTVDPSLAGHVVVGGQSFGLAFSCDDGQSWAQLTTAGTGMPLDVAQPWRFHRMPNGTTFFATEGQPGSTHRRRRGLGDRHQALPPVVFRIEAPSAAAWANPATWQWTDITPRDQQLYGGCNLVDTPYGYGEGSVLLLACSYGATLYSSGDSGSTWTNLNATLSYNQPSWWYPGDPFIAWGRNKVVISNRRPGAWVLASGFGVVSSRDGGHSWGHSSDGFAEVCMLGCGSHPTIPNNTFCGAQDLAGFLIGDGGASGKATASAFAAAPSYWALDFGKGSVAWAPNASDAGPDGVPRPAFSFAGGAKQPQPGPGIWVDWSTPAARASYQPIQNLTGVLAGLSNLEFTDLLQAADDPADILLGVGRGEGWFSPWNASQPSSAFTGGVVRSRDGGVTWQHVTRQPTFGNNGNAWSEYRSMALDGGDVNTRWWGVAGNGLFMSRDRGDTWDPSPSQPYDTKAPCKGGPCPIAVAPDASAATGGAGCAYTLSPSRSGLSLRRTTDFGVSFAVVGNFSFPPPADQYSPYPYLATHRSGRIALVSSAEIDRPDTPHIYVSVDSGASWTAVDRAEEGLYLGWSVTGLHWDATDQTLLYVSTGGHSLHVFKLSQ